MWYLVAIFWIVLVAGIFWAYSRKRAQVAGKRAEALDALIAEATMGAQVVQYPPPPALPAALIEPCRRRLRLLDRADALLYFLFRTGLPDHEVFANMTLADVVEPAPTLPAFEREQLLRRLGQQRLNAVVCNRQLEVVAVAVLIPLAQADAAREVDTCLKAAGIRCIHVDAAALPRHHQVRALVYGESAPGAA